MNIPLYSDQRAIIIFTLIKVTFPLIRLLILFRNTNKFRHHSQMVKHNIFIWNLSVCLVSVTHVSPSSHKPKNKLQSKDSEILDATHSPKIWYWNGASCFCLSLSLSKLFGDQDNIHQWNRTIAKRVIEKKYWKAIWWR